MYVVNGINANFETRKEKNVRKKIFTLEREREAETERGERWTKLSYVGQKNIVDKCDFSCMFLLLLYLVNGLTEANNNTQTNTQTETRSYLACSADENKVLRAFRFVSLQCVIIDKISLLNSRNKYTHTYSHTQARNYVTMHIEYFCNTRILAGGMV